MGRLRRTDIRGFDAGVQDLILDVVNRVGLRYRVQDGGHIRIYTGTREAIPFKVSQNVPYEHVLRKLEPWLDEHVPHWRAEGVVEAAPEDLPFTCGHGCGERFATVEDVNAHHEQAHPPEREWVDAGHGFVTDGTVYQCSQCAFAREVEAGKRGLHLHEKSHQKKEVVPTTETTEEGEQMTPTEADTQAIEALAVLAQKFGAEVVPAGTIARLQEMESLQERYDEMSARMSIITEALKA